MAKSGNLVTISSKTFEATLLFLRLTKRSNACRRPADNVCVHVMPVCVSIVPFAVLLALPLTAADIGGGSERAKLLAARMRHSSTLRATVVVSPWQ